MMGSLDLYINFFMNNTRQKGSICNICKKEVFLSSENFVNNPVYQSNMGKSYGFQVSFHGKLNIIVNY